MNYAKIKNYKEICGNATYYTYGGVDVNKIVGSYEYEEECYIGYNGDVVNDGNITLITKELFDDNYNKVIEQANRSVSTTEQRLTDIELALADMMGGAL